MVLDVEDCGGFHLLEVVVTEGVRYGATDFRKPQKD